MREAFSDRTVITIAHRLPTIIDYSKILVLSAGTVAEFGSPAELLRRPATTGGKGSFAGMVDQTGPAAAAFLRQGTLHTHEQFLHERIGSHYSAATPTQLPLRQSLGRGMTRHHLLLYD